MTFRQKSIPTLYYPGLISLPQPKLWETGNNFEFHLEELTMLDRIQHKNLDIFQFCGVDIWFWFIANYILHVNK